MQFEPVLRSTFQSVGVGFRTLLVLGVFAIGALGCAPAQVNEQDRLSARIAASNRRAANIIRDPHRHPLEVLRFFGVRENSTVVEILPGSGGYYMELLAPWLQTRGSYIAANRDELAPPQYLADHRKLLSRLQDEPEFYGKVVVSKQPRS